MNLIKRIKNLWRISSIQVIVGDKKPTFEDLVALGHPGPKMAKIIKRTNPIQEVLKNEQ